MKNLSPAACLGLTLLLTACGGSSGTDSNPDLPSENNAGNSDVNSSDTGAGSSDVNTSDTGPVNATADNTGTTTSSSSGETTGTSSGTPPGDSTSSPAGNDTNNNIVSLLDAGLSHNGTPVASTPAVANDPFILKSGQDRVASLPNSPAVIFEVVSNQGTAAGLNCTELGAQYNSCNIVNLHMKDSTGELDDNAWKMYFHSTRRILQVSSDEFNVTHVNGDLHYVSPNEQFSGFAGSTKSIRLITEYNYLVESDFQPRYWIARDGVAQLITNTDDDTDESAYAMDITGNNRFEFVGENNAIANAANRFDRNVQLQARAQSISSNEVAARIIPKPTSTVIGAGSLDIGTGFSLATLNLPAQSISALQSRQAQFMSTSAGVSLTSSIDITMPADSYTLSVNADGIVLIASDQNMLFYAAQSLLSLVQPGNGSIPFVEVNDSPRFGFRGMHVDVARNFHSVESMKKLIDQMGAYKFNRLHLHLTDDEGWRLEIPSLPELTSVGGKRGFSVDENGLITETNSLLPAMGSGPNTDNQGSGFYTRAQFIDLLEYANARFINVIPEFDMPAHARAAVVAMRVRARNLGDANNIEVRIDDPDDTSNYLTVQNYNDNIINPCVPGTYSFIQSLVSDVSDMYAAANAPLDIWHLGGDEASNILLGFGIPNPDTSKYDQPWAKSPVCNAFISNTAGVNSRDDLSRYFVDQVAQIVADAGIPSLFAYQDIYSDLNASELATASAGINHWVSLAHANPETSSNSIASANDFNSRGFDTVISAPDYLYFDFPYEVDPKERGYYWATRELDSEKLFSFAPENLAQNASTSLERYGNEWSATNRGSYTGYEGIQGFLWSETVRTPEQFDYMIFPRMLALAERAWHTADWELPYVEGETYSAQSGQVNLTGLNEDYAGFALAMAQKEFAKLDEAGVNYRIPPPGAKFEAGQLQMNSNFPGLGLEFSTDGNTWQTWNAANPPAAATFVRSLSVTGRRAGRVTSVTE